MRRRLQLRIVPICLALVVGGPSAAAATLVVGGAGAQFQSVQPAIAAAHAGDTVQVRAGAYAGNLTLNKQITLEGISRPTLRGEGVASVVTVFADGCVIRGFIIEHSGDDLTREDSGILLKSSNNQIEDNELRDILYGIYLYSSHGNALRRNRVRGRPELEEGDRGAGLHLWNSPDNIIEDNIISEERDGMYIQSCNGNQIRRNRVFNLRYGLHYMFSDRNVFEDNLFSNNVAGAAIMYSNRIEFRRNAFVHNRGFSSFGILFQECNELMAEENFIVDNATGIFMEALRKSTFRHNTIANNDVALQMFSSSDANVFTENNFVDNFSPLQLIGRSTTTKWSENGRGNFWSDYDGYDLNEDGRGDVPLKIQNVFEYMEGNHPRLRLYLESPAARAMAVAEKTFPILKGSAEIDEAPLMKPIELHYCRLRRIPAQRIDETLNTRNFHFNGFFEKSISQFSGGMIQRLGLAVACLPDAPVLVLDEPTVSLDPNGAIQFREFLASLKRKGKTIVFSSHMLADVEELADRVAILVGGKLVALQTIAVLRDELMRSSRMRVVLANPGERLLEAARDVGAIEMKLDGDSLTLTAGAENRLDILRAIEAAGGRIASFATEELSLEDIYMRYVSEEDVLSK